jgi:hypothetical protein
MLNELTKLEDRQEFTRKRTVFLGRHFTALKYLWDFLKIFIRKHTRLKNIRMLAPVCARGSMTELKEKDKFFPASLRYVLVGFLLL